MKSPFLPRVTGGCFMVWEFENDFAIALHLMENKLKEHNEQLKETQKAT
jgi:hypothetical protein